MFICKRVKSCKYGWTNAGGLMAACDYLLKTGKMRPCPVEGCTVYEKRGKRKPKRPAWSELGQGVID